MATENVDIAEIKYYLELYDYGERDFHWIDPENIIGLNKEQIIKQNDREYLQTCAYNDSNFDDSTLDPDLAINGLISNDDYYVLRYFEQCYGIGKACLPSKCQWGITESYIRALIFMIVEYHSLHVACDAPTNIPSSEAIKCLPIFVDAMLNHNRTPFEIFKIQTCFCYFYDHYEPTEEFRIYYNLFSKEEDLIINFLGDRDLEYDNLKKFGIPNDVLPLISNTVIVKKLMAEKNL